MNLFSTSPQTDRSANLRRLPRCGTAVWRALFSAALVAAIPAVSGCVAADSDVDDEEVGTAEQAYTSPKPTAALLIITSSALAPSFQTLANHKNATGMPAQVLTMDQVRSLSPQGADDPEKIKRTIALYAQSYGTRYVLLGGDPTQVPTRHRAVVAEDHVQILSYNFTDHYYANLYKNHNADGSSALVLDTWDGNGDGLRNTEYWDKEDANVANPDNVDGYPDIAVGRVPFATAGQINTYVSKVIAYESAGFWAQSNRTYPVAFVADAAYPTAETLAQQIESSLTWSNQTGNDRRIDIETATPFSALWSTGGTNEIKAAAVATPLMFYVGHGSPTQWGHSSAVLSVGAVNSLNNTTQYPVVFAAGCETAQFAPMNLYPSGAPNDWAAQPGSIGATWLSPTSLGGGMAYIGESLVMPNGPGAHLGSTFAKHVSAGVRVLGDAWHLAQVEYWRTQPRNDILAAPRIFLSTENLLGDPSLRLQVVRRNRAAIQRADWDGDGVADMGVFRGGYWYVRNSSGLNGPGGVTGDTRIAYGQAGDIPVTGDFDGDGRTDAAVFRPSNAAWYIKNSTGLTGWAGYAGQTAVQYGATGDIPMPGDFDGDGVTDPAVFRPSNATWYIANSSGVNGVGGVGGETRVQFGATGDIPVSGDFDGDGRVDQAVFRPSNATWYIRNSSGATGVGGFTGQTRLSFGANGDIPVSGDFDGDGSSDIAVFRPSNGYWYIRNSSGATGVGGFAGETRVQWGANGDVPVSGDYDGDGFSDFVVYRPGDATWYVTNSRGLAIPAPAMTKSVQYGISTDIPVSTNVR